MKRTATLGLLALTAIGAQAAQDPPGWRVGAAAAFTDFDYSQGDVDGIDDSAVGAKVFAQYQFNSWLGIEGAFHNTADFKETLPNELAPDLPAGDYKLGFDGFSASAVFFLPEISEDIGFFLKGGFFDFDAQLNYVDNFSNSGASTNSYDGLMLGGGAVIDIDERFSIRAELEWFDIDFGDLYAANIGLHYAFGGGGSAPAAAAPPPAPAAEAEPEPAPAPPADSDGEGVTGDADQ
ncbi:MAG: porin family protein [Gammaproteobacteria bacterium]|nr:porin family protein [Gammaproteobacteria bacterium]